MVFASPTSNTPSVGLKLNAVEKLLSFGSSLNSAGICALQAKQSMGQVLAHRKRSKLLSQLMSLPVSNLHLREVNYKPTWSVPAQAR